MPAATGLLLQSEHKFEIDTSATATPTWSRLGAGLNSFEPSMNEEVLQDTYLDGEGFGTTTVAGGQLVVSFEGHRLYGDVAQEWIYSKQLSFGKARQTKIKWTLASGAILECPCTIANIEGPSGDANGKGEISFEIHFNGKPTLTPAV